MMKSRRFLVYPLMLFCLFAISTVNYAQNVQISEEAANLEMNIVTPDAYALEIAGPDGYYWKREITGMKEITVSTLNENGEVFTDGAYKLQVSPIYTLNTEEQAELRQLMASGDQTAILAFREANQIPSEIEVYNVSFRIKNGKFVTPDAEPTAFKPAPYQWTYEQESYKAMFASIKKNNVNVSPNAANLAMDNTQLAEDQVFADDVIVQSSICVGFDCANGESFGSDTQRLKENNLRIHFNDTSTSASFPSNDWRITINDTTNGGANYFAVEDATAGRIPFRIEAGAPANALYVDDAGNVGIGTSTPVVEAQITDGDSPTLRLEQNGSSGFGSQTWDIAGNETNFFIRDVTNGSLLPFRIKPRAPKNSIFIDAEGDIGLGTENPGTNALQVESGNVYVKAGNLGVNVVPTVALDVLGNLKLTGDMINTGNITQILGANGATFFNSGFQTVMRLDATNQRVGIGVAAPGHQLELNQDDAVKPNGGSWTAASDRRLKENIKKYTDGLEEVMKINTVTYNYNEKTGYDTQEEHVGIIAQEMQEVAPYMVRRLNPEKNDYLAFDGTALTFMLVNAVQEQQAIINAQKEEITALKAQVDEMAALKAQMAALTQMVADLKNAKTETTAASDDE